MTDTTPEQTTEDTMPEIDQPEIEGQETDQPDEGNANAEAAKYRRRLRETETERDALAEQVDALRRSAIDKEVTGKHRITPGGFWASGVEVTDLLDPDTGQIDPDKVAEAVATATKNLGLERIGSRAPIVPSEGRVTDPSGGGGWQGAFAPR